MLLTHCPHWMSVAVSKQILSDGMRKNHQALLSPVIICKDWAYVLFLCAAGSQAVVNSFFGVRDENNIASHPSGAWQRTRSPPWVSLFNIRVLYSEAAKRAEIYGQCSIRSVSHTHEKTQAHRHVGPGFTDNRDKETDWCRFMLERKVEKESKQMRCWQLERWMNRVQVRPSTPERKMKREVPRKIENIGHTHIFHLFLSFPFLIENREAEIGNQQLIPLQTDVVICHSLNNQ